MTQSLRETLEEGLCVIEDLESYIPRSEIYEIRSVIEKAIDMIEDEMEYEHVPGAAAPHRYYRGEKVIFLTDQDLKFIRGTP